MSNAFPQALLCVQHLTEASAHFIEASVHLIEAISYFIEAISFISNAFPQALPKSNAFAVA